MKQTRLNALCVNHHGRAARAASLLAAAALIAGLAACDMELSDEDERATLIAREKALEEKKLMGAVTDACGVEPVYFSPLKERGSVSIVGDGAFVDDNTFGTGKVFHNVGGEQRKNYLKLPEDICSHSADTKEFSVGVWVKGDDGYDTMFAPLFTCYGAAPTKTPLECTTPSFLLEARLSFAQINMKDAGNLGDGKFHDFADAVRDGGTTEAAKQNMTWLQDGAWHYYTFTMTMTHAVVYLDGAVHTSWTYDGTTAGQDPSDFFAKGDILKYNCLGGCQGWDWKDPDMAASFAKISVWNKALTAEQVAKLVQAK